MRIDDDKGSVVQERVATVTPLAGRRPRGRLGPLCLRDSLNRASRVGSEDEDARAPDVMSFALAFTAESMQSRS
jgi:hypothetical protein